MFDSFYGRNTKHVLELCVILARSEISKIGFGRQSHIFSFPLSPFPFPGFPTLPPYPSPNTIHVSDEVLVT